MSLAHHLLRVLLILAISVNAWMAPQHADAAMMHAEGAGDPPAVTADDGHEDCHGMNARSGHMPAAPAPVPEPDCCAGDACQCDCTQAFTVAPALRTPAHSPLARMPDLPPIAAIADTRFARLMRPPIG